MEKHPDYYDYYQTDMEGLDDSWQQVIAALKQATLECLSQDDWRGEPLAASEGQDFWKLHSQLLKQLENEEPGIADAIMTRAEAISQDRRRQENEHLEEVTLPRVRRQAFWRGVKLSMGIKDLPRSQNVCYT